MYFIYWTSNVICAVIPSKYQYLVFIVLNNKTIILKLKKKRKSKIKKYACKYWKINTQCTHKLNTILIQCRYWKQNTLCDAF